MAFLLIPAKSPEPLLAFLEEEFKPWETLCEEQGHTKLIEKDGHRGPYLELRGKAIRVHVPTDSYKYAFTLMRWVALQVGKKKVAAASFKVQKPVPHYFYSPDSSFPIFLVQKDDPLVSQGNTRFYAVNPLGLSWKLEGATPDAKLKRKLVRAELKRLHNLWKISKK